MQIFDWEELIGNVIYEGLLAKVHSIHMFDVIDYAINIISYINNSVESSERYYTGFTYQDLFQNALTNELFVWKGDYLYILEGVDIRNVFDRYRKFLYGVKRNAYNDLMIRSIFMNSILAERRQSTCIINTENKKSESL